MSDEPELLISRLRDERGFTLVEVMVALAIGLVVSTATLAIVIVSVHLGSNYTDRVDANQQGRLAMERITQALNSSCVTPNQAPILAGSTANTVMFYSGTSDAPGPAPNELTIALTATVGNPAPLTMTTQPLAGTAPNWGATGSSSASTLALWAAPTVQNGVAEPVFSYYPYGSAGVVSTTAFTLGSSGLTAAQAAATAMVGISFQVLPTDAWSATGRAVDFSDSVVFRLTPPSSAPNASNLPCT